MNFDLELVLVLGVVLTGGVWFLDKLIFADRRRSKVLNESHPSKQTYESMYKGKQKYKDPWYIEYSKSFFPILLIVLILRSFVAEPFRIPSGSMMPTLVVGDFILVNKYIYGIRLPVSKTKLFDVNHPNRGDVAVFRYPQNPSDDYIKRIVGLPGDHIAYYNKSLYVNGGKVTHKKVGQYEGKGSGKNMNGALVLKEELDKVTHDILIKPDRLSVEGEFVVPEGEYFVLGDNRDSSNDSRYWGFVPESNLVGKAFLIWMNWDWQGNVFDYHRIGKRIE